MPSCLSSSNRGSPGPQAVALIPPLASPLPFPASSPARASGTHARTHERTCDLLLYKVERTSLPSQPSKQKTGGFLGLSPASTAWNALPCFSCCTPLRRHLQEAHPDCLSPPGSPRCFCGSRASLIQAFSRPFLGFSPQPGPEPGLVWCTAGLLKSLWDESLTPPESWALPPWDPHRVMEGSKEARVRVRTFGPQSSCLYSGCREDLMR